MTVAVVLLTLAALVMEFGSPDQVMVSGLVVLLLAGVVAPESALAGFANPAMLTVGALFVVAAAVRRTGAIAFLQRVMMPRSTRMVPALARIMLPASFFSTFLNNTPVVSFLTPLVQQWSHRAGIPASKLLIPLSYATLLGGMSTLIGTSTNLIVSSLLEKERLAAGEAGVSGTTGGFDMFEMVWIGIPAAVLGFLYFALAGHRLLPSRDDTTQATPKSRRAYQFDLLVPEHSPLIGQSIERAGLRHLEDAFLGHIFRHGELIGPVTPNQTLEVGDVLTFFGDTRVLDDILQKGDLSRAVKFPEGSEDLEDLPHLPFYEAVVSPESSLVGKTLKDSDFRERFQAVVLGIHRAGRRLMGPVGLSTIDAGDLLLIEARPHFEDRWVDSGEFYLVAPLEREEGVDARKASWVLMIVVAMMGSVAAGWLEMVTAAFGAAMLVVLCGSLSPAEARRSVDLSVLVVIASAFGFGSAINETGLASFLGPLIGELAQGLGIVGVLAVVYLFTNVLTEVLTNSVAAVLVFPVGMAIASSLGVDPKVFAVTIATAASASFATPIGYQTNLMVMGPGGYRFTDYIKVGLPLNLLVMALALWVIPTVWM